MKLIVKNHINKNRIIKSSVSMLALILISTLLLAGVSTASSDSFILGPEKLIGSGQHPSIATSPVDGTMHVVYVNNGLRYRSYNPTTGSLEPEELVASGEIWGPQIAVSGDGDIHVVWEQNPLESYIGYSRKISGVWKSAGNLNSNTNRAMMPRIDVDSNNLAHIVFWKNIISGTNLTYGQYIRIGKISGLPNIELRKDIDGWNGNRYGDIVIDGNNIPHVFSGQISSIRHWTVSESGLFSVAPTLPKPSDPNIEKFMEGISVATGAGGGFYAFSKDLGAREPKEVFSTRIGGAATKIVSNSPATGKSVVAAGDLAVNGRAYAIFADENKKGRVLAIDADGSIIGPTLFADAGNQHDGVDRHGPGGIGVKGGGLWVVYQDDRSGTWQVYIRKISTGNSPEPTYIMVISPDGGENLNLGTTHNIRWNSSGSPGTDVKIELLKSGVSSLINSNSSNNGSYRWTVPATQTPGSDYKVKVTSTSNSSYTDTSDNYFTIRQAASSIVPQQSEWIEKGTVLTTGAVGSWDVRFGGALSPSAVIKKNGTYFLYYIGADGDRKPGNPESIIDPGPRHRALGVATSKDGINFVKYANNPILTYLPNNNEEEGIFSASLALDDNGDIVMYYSAMDAGSEKSTTVDSDIRLAISKNGFDFTQVGDVISHSNPDVWGFGDEMFPIGTLHANNKWYVYYIAKNSKDIMWDIGLASGTTKENLITTESLIVYPPASASSNDIIGGTGAVVVGDKIVSFFQKGRAGTIQIRITPLNTPEAIPEPTDIYQFNYTAGSVDHAFFFDQEINTWFMYYWDGSTGIKLRTVNRNVN